MTDATLSEDAEPAKSGKKALLIGVLAAVVFGGAAFFVTFTGIFPKPANDQVEKTDSHGNPIPNATAVASKEIVFVPLEPLVISLGSLASSRHLRFRGYLEVEPDSAAEVEHLSPRILDVLNTYLRAVSEKELTDPASMNRLRAQMLRRVQVVVGADSIRDLLITEFILN